MRCKQFSRTISQHMYVLDQLCLKYHGCLWWSFRVAKEPTICPWFTDFVDFLLLFTENSDFHFAMGPPKGRGRGPAEREKNLFKVQWIFRLPLCVYKNTGIVCFVLFCFVLFCFVLFNPCSFWLLPPDAWVFSVQHRWVFKIYRFV